MLRKTCRRETWRGARACRWAAVTCAVGLAACQTHNLDARFEAGWRPAKGYCAFGGETAQLSAYCARVNFGADGSLALLRAENSAILRKDDRLRCTEHVALARSALERYGDYTVAPLYSCDDDTSVEGGRKVCHVSLLVTDAISGARYVMDNGYVLRPQVWDGVATYEEFRERVDHAWTGAIPAWMRLGHD